MNSDDAQRFGEQLGRGLLDSLGFNVVVSDRVPPGEVIAFSAHMEEDGPRISAAKITNIRDEP